MNFMKTNMITYEQTTEVSKRQKLDNRTQDS